jgi:hypothetical protein
MGKPTGPAVKEEEENPTAQYAKFKYGYLSLEPPIRTALSVPTVNFINS